MLQAAQKSRAAENPVIGLLRRRSKRRHHDEIAISARRVLVDCALVGAKRSERASELLLLRLGDP